MSQVAIYGPNPLSLPPTTPPLTLSHFFHGKLGKTVPVTIPLEILDEFFYLIAEKENLKEMSLVCRRWRYLSQRELFAVVQVDPMFTYGVCQVATPLHAHLATYIKEIWVVNIHRTTTSRDAKPTFRCSPQFRDFLRSLPALQTIYFRHPHLDWVDVSEYVANAFLGVFSRPSFRTLEVPGGKNIPIALFLHRTNVDTLAVMETKDVALPFYVEHAGAFETRLTSLSLLDSDTINTILAFFRTSPTVVHTVGQNLTSTHIEIC